MATSLSNVPVGARRRLSVVLGLFAVLFTAVGAVAATGGGTSTTVFSAVGLVVAVLLALIAWGVWHSVTIDLAEQRLDRAISDTIGATGLGCGCGHEHDPDDLHVTEASCAHDGDGATCNHDCATCVLAGLRQTGSPSSP